MCPLHLDDHPAATVTRPWFQLGTLSLAPDQHALMVSTCFSPRHMHVQGDSSHLFETTAIITLATRSRDITYVTRSLVPEFRNTAAIFFGSHSTFEHECTSTRI